MYRFNDIAMVANKEGVLIIKDGRETQVYIGKPVKFFVEGKLKDWMEMTDLELLNKAKAIVCEESFKFFNGNRNTAQMAIDGRYDELVKTIGGYSKYREIYVDSNGNISFGFNSMEENRNVSGKIKMIEKELASVFERVKESYERMSEKYRRDNGYERIKVQFTIGEGDRVYEYSHGVKSDVNYPRDIGLGIIDSLNYVDEYGFNTFSEYMCFIEEFGYSCSCDIRGMSSEDNISRGEAVIEEMKSMRDDMNMEYEYNFPAIRWLCNGFGDGDDKLAQMGYPPLDDIEYSTCFAIVKFKDGKTEERKIGFYEDGEEQNGDQKDEDTLLHFKVGDELVGKHGDFEILSVRWDDRQVK